MLFAFAEMGELLKDTPFGSVTPERLRHAIRRFLTAVVDANWTQYMHPKFHWLLHYPRQLARFLWLPACWQLERKHKDPKRVASLMFNLTVFEKSLLREVTCLSLSALGQAHKFDSRVGLRTPRKATKKQVNLLRSAGLTSEDMSDDEIFSSAEARYSVRGWCRHGDVALLRCNGVGAYIAAEVWVHFDVRGVCFTLVSVWDNISTDRDHLSAVFRKHRNPQFYPLEDIQDVCIAKRYADDSVRVVIDALRYLPPLGPIVVRFLCTVEPNDSNNSAGRGTH